MYNGMVSIKEAAGFAPDLQFSDVNGSGFGRELVDIGIGEFVNRKVVRITR
jgi:succinate-semialdehyde dehydrogenase/glutarate-semialdehyde dehydrogenase